jgi:hypothetical protein
MAEIPEPKYYCCANACHREADPGRVLCTLHGRILYAIDPAALRALARIDPRGILERACNYDTIGCLEAIASAVERIAEDRRMPIVNTYRLRAVQLRKRLGGHAPVDPETAPLTQARLLEELPPEHGGGAYGPAGRGR